MYQFVQGGGGPAEPVLYTGSELADDVKINAKGGEPAGLAFTMAEILLSLTIIGVVAAITLPSLTGNINERTWNTQRKALYARFSQTIALMPSLNGYGTLSATEDTAAETFVTEGLTKVLKINNICDADHLADCGVPAKVTTLDGTSVFSIPSTLLAYNDIFSISACNSGAADINSEGYWTYAQQDTKAAAFETQNGESILVYYNPNCQGAMGDTAGYFAQPKMCANFVYDLNGNKGPNTVGKDVGFMTAMYPSDAIVVAPVPLQRYYPQAVVQPVAGEKCKEMDSESRVPNRDELASMFYNEKLLGAFKGHYWSSTIEYDVSNGSRAWIQYFDYGRHFPFQRDGLGFVWCVKR